MNTSRLFVGGTETDLTKLAPVFDSSAQKSNLIRSLPSFKRSGGDPSRTAASSSFAASSHAGAGAGPSGSHGKTFAASASGAGTPKTAATTTNNALASPSPAVPANQPQRLPNLSRAVAQTIIRNIQSPNLYTPDNPLFVYKWFLGLQLQYNKNGRFVQLLV